MPVGYNSISPPKLSKDASTFLLELAEGKHDKAVAYVQRLLGIIGKIWPPALLVSRAISVFMMVNKWTAPWGGVVPDGRGGVVPKSNPRVHPTNGRFIKFADGKWIYDDWMGDAVKEKFPPP